MLLPVETDDRIIAALQKEADLTYRELAGKLDLNESTVRKRVLALRKKNIIRRFIVDVDAVKLGYRSNGMFGVDADPSKLIEVGAKLSAIPEARFVFSTAGESDFQVVVWTRSREEIAGIMDQISRMEGVLKVTPNFTIERLK